MKKKIVLWGTNEEDKKVLIGLELKEKENKVNIYTFEQEKVTEDFFNKMMDEWRNNKEIEFPEGYETTVRELSMTDDLLPETLRVQRGDVINRAKAEWHFVVLSSKLYELYNSELEDFKERVGRLMDFDGGIWEEMKGFWSKVVEQSRERNLFRDHAERLKDETNKLFTQLKELKSKANEELGKASKEHVDRLSTRLDSVKEKMDKGMSLSPLFDDLKKIQNEFKNADLTRNDRSKLWKRIDASFKALKEKKYGKPQDGQGAASRLERRAQGLQAAVDKMQRSIQRDKSDIEFQNKRAAETNGQLEAQIRQAKIKMIEERISSKQDKLNEMLDTQKDLMSKIEKEKVREEKRAEKEEIKKKQQELKAQKDKEAASTSKELSEEENSKLQEAANAINTTPKKNQPKKESMLGAAAAVIGDAVEDVVDSVKAVAEVAKDKIADKVEDTKEAILDKKEGEANIQSSGEDQEKKESSTLLKGGMIGAAVAAGAKLMDSASDKIEELAEKTGLDDTIEKVKDKVGDMKASVLDKKEEVSDIDATIEKAEEALAVSEEAIASKEEKEGSTLLKGGMIGAAVAAGAKLMDSASDKLEELAEKTGLDDTLEKVKDKVEDLTEGAKDKVSEIKGSLEGTEVVADEALQDVADRVKSEGASEEE